jgi:hypothetical protein
MSIPEVSCFPLFNVGRYVADELAGVDIIRGNRR